MADNICYEKIILEIKAINNLLNQHTAQVLNYLKATGLKVGLLVTFKRQKAETNKKITGKILPTGSKPSFTEELKFLGLKIPREM